MRDNATILRGIRKRGNSYQFTVSVGFDGDGKQVRHYMTYTPPANISETKRDKLVQEAYWFKKHTMSFGTRLRATGRSTKT